MMTNHTTYDVLDIPMLPNDAGVKTVREYLIRVLSLAWAQEDGFNGKRPFGNSGWQHELCEALATAGHVEHVDDGWHGYDVEACERTRELVADAILTMGQMSLQAVMQIHTKCAIYPIAQDYDEDNEECPHCGQIIDGTYGPGMAHDEDPEGILILCLAAGPDHHVCDYCHDLETEENSWPCATMRALGVTT